MGRPVGSTPSASFSRLVSDALASWDLLTTSRKNCWNSRPNSLISVADTGSRGSSSAGSLSGTRHSYCTPRARRAPNALRR